MPENEYPINSFILDCAESDDNNEPFQYYLNLMKWNL